MVTFWIDDMRDPTHRHWKIRFPTALENNDVKWIKSYDELVELISVEHIWPDCICFDHDLGGEKTGYDCAKYIVECMLDDPSLKLPEMWVQSDNVVGRENILKLIRNFIKTVFI